MSAHVCICQHVVSVSYPDGEAAFALAHCFFVGLPLVWSAGLGHVGWLLSAQTLTQLIHLQTLRLPAAVEGNKKERKGYR